MARLTITEAIRRSGIGRTQFYSHYIKKGIISVSEDNGKRFIDSSEVIRVFGELKPEQSDSVQEVDAGAQNSELIKLLREQLEKAEQREQKLIDQNNTLMLRLAAPAKRENWFTRFWNAKD